MRQIRRVGRQLLLLLLATCFLYACGSGPDETEKAGGAAEGASVQRAAEPNGAGTVAETATPAGPSTNLPSAAEEAPALFSGATLARIQRGMSPEQVAQIAGNPGYSVGGDGNAIEVLRYEDAAGNYFTVRYDDGVLRTRTNLHRSQSEVSATPPAQNTSAPPAAAGDRPVAEIAPGVFIPLERAVASSKGQPRGVENAPMPAPDNGEVAGDGIRWTPTAGKATTPAEPSVVVAGGRDRDGSGSDDRSYRPRASLPAFTRSLRDGVFELRFMNPGESTIRVGIRQENLGLDATVPPGDHASLKVDKGVYALYFIRESEPYTRYEADPITIDGFTTTDLEIRLDPTDVAVSLIDYGKPSER